MSKPDTQTPPEAPGANETTNAGLTMAAQGAPGQPQEIIPIQLVWQILGEKEWSSKMKDMQLAQAQQETVVLRQRLTEALTELTTVREQHTTTLMQLVELREMMGYVEPAKDIPNDEESTDG